MKIDAVELTLFAWDDIPPIKYSQGSQNVSGRSNLGLLRIGTDEASRVTPSSDPPPTRRRPTPAL